MSGDMQDLCEILGQILAVLQNIDDSIEKLIPPPTVPTPTAQKPVKL